MACFFLARRFVVAALMYPGFFLSIFLVPLCSALCFYFAIFGYVLDIFLY